jgi:heme-degrading monooxygenase HmoA
MTFRQGEAAAFRKIFEESKDQIRAFAGNRHVELLQDVSDPCVFFTYSLWENEQALEAYRHSGLFEKTWARTKVLFAGKPQAWSTEKLSEGTVAEQQEQG